MSLVLAIALLNSSILVSPTEVPEREVPEYLQEMSRGTGRIVAGSLMIPAGVLVTGAAVAMFAVLGFYNALDPFGYGPFYAVLGGAAVLGGLGCVGTGTWLLVSGINQRREYNQAFENWRQQNLEKVSLIQPPRPMQASLSFQF
jgi:hypothetical protein